MKTMPEPEPITGAEGNLLEPSPRAMPDPNDPRPRLDPRDQELEHIRQDLRQFVHAASHDLQEPLRLVAGFAQLLQNRYRGTLDSKADSYINTITAEVGRMQAMLQGLTELSRIDSRGGAFVTTSLDESLDQALLQLRAELRETDAHILREPLPTVQADPIQMVQLFRNLVGNALRFRGDPTPEIRIRAERREKEWVVSVRDNGLGIPDRFAERVFVVFQRLHPHGRHPGIGIGLTLGKRILERHGGRIWVESGQSPGATLCFSLPDKDA